MNEQYGIAVLVIQALDACKIPYLLAGSFSSNYYGIPRSTKDVDFVVQLRGGLQSEFARHLGEDFQVNPQLFFETITGTYKQEIAHLRSAFTVEVFQLSADPHDQSRFGRRQSVRLDGRDVWFPAAEDVIVTKLRWGRHKDHEDVRDVISVQRGRLDWPYIEKWCGEHGTLALLNEIRRTVPEI